MNDYVLSVQLKEMTSAINAVKHDINVLKETIKPDDELWDGSDITRKWKVSERTLADWRKKKIIGFVQINKKIYYSREARERFLQEHNVNNLIKKI